MTQASSDRRRPGIPCLAAAAGVAAGDNSPTANGLTGAPIPVTRDILPGHKLVGAVAVILAAVAVGTYFTTAIGAICIAWQVVRIAIVIDGPSRLYGLSEWYWQKR